MANTAPSTGLEHSTAQAKYHEAYYETLYGNEDALSGLDEKVLSGPDQLGHLGASGCDRIVESIIERFAGRTVNCLELGSGVGGPMRHILNGLQSAVDVRIAFGADIVERHCQVMRNFGERATTRPRADTGCMSVTDLGLRSGSFDVVFAVGSAPQLPNMRRVLAEAYRVLAPGGLLTLLDEVGTLAGDIAPSAAFLAKHPEHVFHFSTVEQRRRDLAAAGFSDIAMLDLSSWAATVLRKRLIALKIYRADVERIYGTAELAEIISTLEVARAEITRGVVVPTHVLATRADPPR